MILWSDGAQTMEVLEDIKKKLEQSSTFIQPMQAYNHTNIYQAMEQYLMRAGYDVDMQDYAYDDNADAIKVEFLSPGEKILPADGQINLQADGTIHYFRGDGISLSTKYAQYRNVTFRLSIGSQSVEVQTRVHIGWDVSTIEGKLDTALEGLTWDTIKGNNTNTSATGKENPADWWDTVTVEGEASEDLHLPTSLPGGITVKWASRNTDAMSVSEQSDGSYLGSLNRPRKGADPLTFTLTAIATFNNIDDYMNAEFVMQGEQQDWLTGTKNFVITIAPNTEDPGEQMQAALESKYESLIKDFVNKEKDIDLNAVTDDLQMPAPGTLTSEGIMDRWYYKVKMESGNEDVLNFNGYHAEIYRPLPGEPDVKVPYTITIHKFENEKDVYAQKTFYLTVKALTQEEIDQAKAFMEKVLDEAVYWEGIRGSNTDKNSVTKDMDPFVEILQNETGELEYVRGAINLTFGGIEVDDLPGYDPFNNETFREFRTSKPKIVQYETLTGQLFAYNRLRS